MSARRLIWVLVLLTACSSGSGGEEPGTTVAPTGATATTNLTPATTLIQPPTTTSSTTTTLLEPPRLEVLAPAEGATVASRDLEFKGRTDPGCTVDVGGRYFADVALDGSWTLQLLLEPGPNATTFTARDPATQLTTRRAVQVSYVPPLTLRPDGLGELSFATPEGGAVAYLVDILGPPSSDEFRSPDIEKSSYERVLYWTSAGLEVTISDDGGRAPGGSSLWLQPPGLTRWRAVQTAYGPRLETPDGVGLGTPASMVCHTYASECDGDSLSVSFSGNYWDASVPRLWFAFDGLGAEPSTKVVEMVAAYSGDDVHDYEAAIRRLHFRARLLGTWRGSIAAEETPPYAVELHISQDGFVATNLDHVASPPLFFGVPHCAGPSPYDPCGSWDVSSVADGSGQGWLMIHTAAQEADAAGLRNIRLTANDAILDFDLWWTEFNPHQSIHFHGTRTAPP